MRLLQKQFAQLLHLKRKAEGLSLREVEQDSGINMATFSRMEQGRNFRMDKLLQACAWLNVHPGIFFEAEGGDRNFADSVELLQAATSENIAELDAQIAALQDEKRRLFMASFSNGDTP